MSSVRSDMSRMKRMLKSLETLRPHRVQVGIFGQKMNRDSGTMTNAELGFIHEFGSPTRGIPPRSMLRMPINLKGKEIYAKAFKDSVHRIHATADAWMHLLEQVGRSAHDVIQQAFNTGGFGSWKPLKPATARRKGSEAILIDTGNLRRSFLWRVV